MRERLAWSAAGGAFCGAVWGWLIGSWSWGALFAVVAFLALLLGVWGGSDSRVPERYRWLIVSSLICGVCWGLLLSSWVWGAVFGVLAALGLAMAAEGRMNDQQIAEIIAWLREHRMSVHVSAKGKVEFRRRGDGQG